MDYARRFRTIIIIGIVDGFINDFQFVKYVLLETKRYHILREINFTITDWLFLEFSITQILCEINFGDSRSAKSAVFTHLEALNFDLYEFLGTF